MKSRTRMLAGASILVSVLSCVLEWAPGPRDRGQVEASALLPGPILHTDFWINDVAFSPDGSRFVTAGGSMAQLGECAVWDTEYGNKRFVLAGHRGPVHTVAFSADGSFLASAGHDDTVRFWDPDSGALQKMLHIEGLVTMALSPDGHRFVTASMKQQIALWEVATLMRLHNFTGVGRPVFAPDGRTLVLGDQDIIQRFDVETGHELAHWPATAGVVYSSRFSPDGRQLAVIHSSSPDVDLWDVATGKLAGTLIGHQGVVAAVAFAPNSRTLASGGLDRTIRLWDVTSGRVLGVGTGHTARISALAFASDGQYLISTGYDKTVRFWRIVPAN